MMVFNAVLSVEKCPGYSPGRGKAELSSEGECRAEVDAGMARPEWSGEEAGRKLCRVTGLGLDRHKASTHCSFVIKSAQPRKETPLKHYKRQLRRGKEGAGAPLPTGVCVERRAGCWTRLTKYKSSLLCNSLISTGRGRGRWWAACHPSLLPGVSSTGLFPSFCPKNPGKVLQ